MAGTIFVSKDLRLAVSSRQFDYLVQYIRSAFAADESDVEGVIFEPMDEGGMDFISASALSKGDFGRFASAVVRAHKSASADKSGFLTYGHLWAELEQLLHSDSRLSEFGC